MSNLNSKIITLHDEINKSVSVLKENYDFYVDFQKNDLPKIGETRLTAMGLSQIIVDFYTCSETIFFRISKFFENNLSKDQWHKELLDRMRLDITGIRPHVITDETFYSLRELY